MIIEEEIKKIYLDIDSFEGKIQDVVNNLLQIEKTAKSNGYSDIRISISNDYTEEYDHYVVKLYGKREETEKEKAKRIRLKEKARIVEEKRVKKEIEELNRIAEKHGFTVVKK